MTHKKTTDFDFPTSLPSSGGNYVRDKSGELSLVETAKPVTAKATVKASTAPRKAKPVAVPAPAPATEEGS